MWEVVHVCTTCRAALSDDERFYRSGVCPHCGAFSRGTIADSDKVVRRKVVTGPVSWLGRLFGYREAWHWEYKEQ